MKRSEQINELASALSKFQGQIKNAPKDSSNPYFHSNYTDLATAWDAIRSPLAANGLSVVQDAVIVEAKVSVTSLLMHTSGQWIESTLDFTPKDLSPQSVGSCLSYGRRYLLMAQTGLAGEDDDAESATDHKAPPKAEPKPTQKKRELPIQMVEEPKAENKTEASYFTRIMRWVNAAKIADSDKISLIARTSKVKSNEAALKEIYDEVCK